MKTSTSLNIFAHPNLLKVLHSYIWFLSILLNLLIYFAFFNLLLSLSSFFLSFLIALLLIKRLQKNFITWQYTFTQKNNELYLNNTNITTESFSFSTHFLEQAYGLYRLKVSSLTVKGIDKLDRKRIENWRKNVAS